MMKCFIFVKAFSFGRQLFFWSGGAMDGHRDSGKPTCSGEYFSSYISKFHCWFLQTFSLSGEQAWSGFDEYLVYAATFAVIRSSGPSVVKWSKMKVLRTDWNLNDWIELVFLIPAPQTVRKTVAV
jgi:hypothetical protein